MHYKSAVDVDELQMLNMSHYTHWDTSSWYCFSEERMDNVWYGKFYMILKGKSGNYHCDFVIKHVPILVFPLEKINVKTLRKEKSQ